MSRLQLIDALRDIYGYGTEDFEDQTTQEIWWLLDTNEKESVSEYIHVEELQLA